MTIKLSLRETMRRYIPTWFSDRVQAGCTVGFRYLYPFWLLGDVMIDVITQGVYAKMPGIGTPTALPEIGRDRRIRRGFQETDEGYAARLTDWRYAWKHAGNAYTILRQCIGFVSPKTPQSRLVNADGTWWNLEEDGATSRVVTLPTKNWDWDGQDSLWSRFWVIIYQTDAQATWERDGTWGDGEVWGSDPNSSWGITASVAQVKSIRTIIGDWKSAEGVCVNIIFSFDPDHFKPDDTNPPLPDGTWGHWSINNGTAQVPSRDSDGIYCDGIA